MFTGFENVLANANSKPAARAPLEAPLQLSVDKVIVVLFLEAGYRIDRFTGPVDTIGSVLVYHFPFVRPIRGV